ncbi:outer envelope protein [Canna indica]|uniref:Outer envelope protein n=1 Tax=Canna indica TaxID=4628 RepID=A0AAQ3KPP4_9LILI|nr:outer envelope protein [Canna indica]
MNLEMVKMASETIGKMSPEEFQKMLKVASSLTTNQTPQLATTNCSAQISENGFQSDIGSSSRLQSDIGERNFEDAFLSSRMGQSSSSIPTSMDDLQCGHYYYFFLALFSNEQREVISLFTLLDRR